MGRRRDAFSPISLNCKQKWSGPFEPLHFSIIGDQNRDQALMNCTMQSPATTPLVYAVPSAAPSFS